MPDTAHNCEIMPLTNPRELNSEEKENILLVLACFAHDFQIFFHIDEAICYGCIELVTRRKGAL